MKNVFGRIITFVVLAMLAVGIYHVETYAATWSGSGTQASPYLITNESGLRQLATNVKNGTSYSGKYFRVTANIALTQNWTPIGTASTAFRGTFDGNGKTISGMSVTGDHVGLFAYVGSGATIQNVNLTDITVTGETYLSGLVAEANAGTGTITISGCDVSGSLQDMEDSYNQGYLAGIVGYANAEYGSITISNCTTAGNYLCDYHSGGIVGYGKGSDHSLKILNCTNNAYINADDNSNNCGGIAGYLTSAELVGCMNYGSVYGNGYSEDDGSSWLGGIAGEGGGNVFIGCGNYGSVTTFFAGGITPSQYGRNVVDSCLNMGKLSYSSDGYGVALIRFGTAINSYYSSNGSGITGASFASTTELESGAVAWALRDYFGQELGVDPKPVPLTASNRVYKVSVVGEVTKTYYVNAGDTITLPELSECAAYFDNDSKFDPSTAINRDYALAAKSYHNYVDGVCMYCGNDGISYVDVGNCGTSVAWVLDTAGVLTISGSGAMTNYSSSSAPWAAYKASIKTVKIEKGVTSVGDYAFNGMTNVTAVSFADTVTTIGKYAFAGQTNLSSLTLGNAVTAIGDHAFANCTGLSSLTLSEQLRTIGNYAFSQCTGLTYVALPSNTTTLGAGAFRQCTALTSIQLGALTTIGDYALSEIGATSLTIPATVTSIGGYAFADSTALKTVGFSGAAPSIASTAFSGDTVTCHVPQYDSSWQSNVQKQFGGTLTWDVGSGYCGTSAQWVLDFSGTLTVFGTGKMNDCSYTNAPWYALRDRILAVVIAEGVTSIGDYAFNGCTNLHTVTFADSVTQIGTQSTYSGYGHSFMGCTGLTQITIPKNVTTIGYGTFTNCTNLTAINVESGNTAYTSVDGVLYDRYKQTLHSYPAGKTGAFAIPSGVNTIGHYAFYKNAGLTEVTIPSSVTTIQYEAFYGCTKLKKVTFEGNVPTSLGSYAFLSVTADAYFPAGDTTWTISAMRSCGSSMKWHIGSGTCGKNAQWELLYTNSAAMLTISGTGAMDDYTYDTTPWKDYIADIQTFTVGNGITHVGAYALCPGNSSTASTSLRSITLADSVTSIGNGAFCFCTKLNTVSWGNGLRTIGESAFVSTALTSIDFPDSLQTVGKYAFEYCYSLKSIAFGSNMQSVGYTAFAQCTALQTVDLGNSITALEQSAFNECSNLTKIVIPASVTSVGTYAFRNCTNLQYVEFLGNAPTFNSNAFYGTTCNIYYPASNSTWTSGILANYGGTLTWGAVSQKGSCGTNAEWFLDTAGNLCIYGSGYMSTYSATTNAPWYAYRNDIQRVILRGVSSVGAYAFKDCAAIDDVLVGSTVTSIGTYAFSGCADLQVVIFDGSAPNFGTDAFAETTCEMWYKSSWSTSYLKQYGGTLTWRKATAMGTCGTNARWILDSSGTLVVLGSGEMAYYSTASYQPWYGNNTAITSVIIGGKVTKVNRYAFSGCTNLKTVTFGNAVTEIYDYAFSRCTALQTLTFHDGVTDIGTSSFYGCTALRSITIGKGMAYINLTAFSGCTALNEITFLGNAPGITYNAFNGVVATVYYPMFDSTWTSSVMYDHGGTLTWVAVCMEHKAVNMPAVAPACTSTGLTEGSYCSLCNEILVAQEVIPATGHYALNADGIEVPAGTIEQGCNETIVCTVCNKVAKEAPGHRVLGKIYVEADPLTINNPTSYPYELTDGTYYSTNKANSSSSTLQITAKYDCTLTLNYGVSSEEDYDKLSILLNGYTKDTLSGTETGTITLTLSAGDVVGIRYKKDGSASSGEDRGWVTLIYSNVMVEGVGDVPAGSAEPDCTNAVVCRYCQTVVKEALGHRVIVQQPEPENPFVVTNTATVPFVLTDDTYYSSNHGGNSVSDLLINAEADCTLILNYGVSSETTYDKLTILLNGTVKDTISGLVSGKTMELNVKANDVITVRYSKDSSINKNDDRGWVSVQYKSEPTVEIVPADTVETDCDGVTCDYCQTLVKDGLGHQYTSVVTGPTCTEKGHTEYTCSACSHSYTGDEVDVLGHDYSVTVSTIVPNCTEQGSVVKKCSRCDSTETTYTDALGHDMVEVPAVEPTCTETGLTVGTKCDRCGEIGTAQTLVEVLGHSFTEYVSDGDATCATEGTKTAVCDRCDVTDTITDADSKVGHNYTADPTTCGICGHVRMSLGISSVVLRPSVAGLYFKGSFTFEDEVKVSRYGIAVSLSNKLPVADDTDPTSLHTADQNSVLISNILDGGSGDAQNGRALIYARPYVLLEDGTYIYGDVVVTNLKSVVETIDSQSYENLGSSAIAALNTMYRSFLATMQDWLIPNIKSYAAEQ